MANDEVKILASLTICKKMNLGFPGCFLPGKGYGDFLVIGRSKSKRLAMFQVQVSATRGAHRSTLEPVVKVTK